MSITAVRILSAIALFALTIVAGALPPVVFSIWRNRKHCNVLNITNAISIKKNKRWLSYNNIMKILMFFGGGILLATCFIHLIPEVRENLDHFFEHRRLAAHLKEEHDHGHHEHGDHDHDHDELNNGSKGNETDNDHDHDHDHHLHNESEAGVPGAHGHGKSGGKGHEGHSHGIPYVELAVCMGFFVIYLLEELVHTFIGCEHEDGDDLMTDGLSSSDSSSSIASPAAAAAAPLSMARSTLANTPAPDFGPVTDKKIAPQTFASTGHDNFAIDIKSEGGIVDEMQTISHPPLYATGSSDALVLPSSDFKHSTQPQSKFLQPKSVRFVQGLVIIIAFSAHSIFDGVAIGLQEQSTSLWTMFFAICSHKLVVALAIGMEVFEKTQSLAMTWIHMSLFSAMSPLGILIVIFTESRISNNDSPVIILLSAVATGTILYIVFFEILQRGKKTEEPQFFGLVLYLSMIIGFAIMFYLTLSITH